MGYGEWQHGPFGLNAQRGQTLRYQRTVLVVVHTVTAGIRLGDVVPLIEADTRVQVVYTHAPSALISAAVPRFLARVGGVVVPWRHAMQAPFDLALAASDGLLEWVHAPVLTMQHGVGYNKYPVLWDGDGVVVQREAAGPERIRLVCHGRTIASAIMLPTRRQIERLCQSCPEAAAVAVNAGDPCYDRLAVSLACREAYRRALGVGERKLVAVSSTWSPGSLYGRHPDLIADLVRQLPAHRYQVAACLHPGIWDWHGRRQILAWLAEPLRRGLILVPPEEGWRAMLAAADVVVGDHGSVTCYAAAAGIPVLMAAEVADEVEPGSPVAILGQVAPLLRPCVPYAEQLDQATDAWGPEQHASIRALVTDAPGRSAQIIRSAMYRLMKLPAPACEPRALPVPVPRPVTVPETFGGRW